MAWVAEDNFDSYSDGDLNGNNGGSGWSAAWAGDVDYDVEGTTVYQGAKAVSGINANGSIIRTLTSTTTSGTVYFAMRMDDTSGDGGILFRNGADTTTYILIKFNTTDIVVSNGFETTTTYISGFTTGAWYLFEIAYNGASYDIRYHNGTSWSSPNTYSVDTNSAIDTIRLNAGNNNDFYFDYISPTNPIPETGGDTKARYLNLMGVG